MNHKILAWVMALVLVVSLMPAAALATDDSEIDDWGTAEAGTEGEWTAEGNYDISWYTGAAPGATTFTLSDAADLAGLAVIVNGEDATGNSVTATMGGENGEETTQTIQDSFEGKTITLQANTTFDLSAHTWTPIGTETSTSFQGTFDGNSESGTKITGLTIKTTGIDAGLFGVVKEATIKNVAVENADIDVTLSMHDTVGGIVGLADGKTANTKSSGSISNCTFSGTIKVNSDNSISTYGSYAGGIVGSNGKNGNNANYPGLTVENCTNNGKITGNAVYMGGIVGANGYQDTVKNCINQGAVTCTKRGNSYSTGGIAGVTYGDIEDCTNRAEVTIEYEGSLQSSNSMGGIVGTMYSCKVSNCSNEGAISSGSVYNIGGIAGLISVSSSNTTAEISSCRNTGNITGSDFNYNTVQAGGIVGIASIASYIHDATISITECSNSGSITGSGRLEPYLGGIVGIGSGSGFTLSQCYNSGAVCAENANTAQGGSSIGGLVGSLRGGTVSSSYNVGAVANETSQAGAGGLVGDVRNGSVELSDCYNAGTVSATNSSAPTGGIVGKLGSTSSSVTVNNCSYWDECVQTSSTSYGTSRTANQMTEDNLWNDESHLGLSTETWEKTDNNLSDANNLIGYLPVLTSNEQEPAPELKRTVKKDQNDLTISGALNGENLESNGQLLEDSGPVQLTATGGSGDGAITWAVASTGDIQASIDGNGQVNFTGSSGTVTVTATRAGNDEYNSVSTTYSFTVYPTSITEVKIIDLKAPVQGEEPVMELSVPEDAHYSVLREVDLGDSYWDVSWLEDGNTFSGTFKQGGTYTVTIRVKAENPYSFADNVDVILNGIQENAYSDVNKEIDDNGQLVITLTFNPTDHTHNWDEENWSSDATHHWHACQNEGCPLIGDDYAEHTDADGDGVCDICNATIGYLITFNANGGTCDTESIHTNVKGLLSELPVPTRGGYTFLGWFTAASGGEQVTADTAFTEDMTVYAQWKANSSGSPTRYPVTVEDSAHGQVKSNPASAKRGETVTITVTPDEGYETASVTVTGQNGNPVAVTDHGDGTYSFIQPTGKVTVRVTFVCDGLTDHCPSYPFADVDTTAWYHLAVDFAVENGITNGTSATTFGPDLACTRGQMVTFLWRAAGSPAPENAANPFTDLVEGAYYYDAVLWATGEGITLGTSATTFSPEDTVTRGQAVTFLWRQAGSPLASGTLPFADVDAGAYYAGAVGWAAGEGIALGTSAAAFSPENPCTRAQIVTFLYRATV